MTPEQIDDYCKRLAEAWKKLPDERLGKLFGQAGEDIELCDRYSPYWCEDEALITAIERMVENDKIK